MTDGVDPGDTETALLAFEETRRPVANRKARRKLRVLLVTEAASAGVGRHVIDLAAGLIGRGHETHVAFSPTRIDPAFEAGLCSLPSLHAHELRMRRAPHPADLAARTRLTRIVREKGPFDVLHAHSTKAGLLVRSLPDLTGARVLYTPHCVRSLDPALSAPARSLVGRVERALSRRTDALIAVSPEERDHLVGLGVEPRRVHVVPNGVGPFAGDAAAARRVLGMPERATVLGFVGRLCAQKNPGLALEALALLRPYRPDLCLAMVGDGPLKGALVRRAHALGLAGCVGWTRAVPAERVLAGFDAFVLPSGYEGLPYVLLEALSAGLPVVATDVGGARQAIEEGWNGAIVPRGDAQALARALVTWVDDPAARRAAAGVSRALARRFSLDAMLDSIEGLYRGHAAEEVSAG